MLADKQKCLKLCLTVAITLLMLVSVCGAAGLSGDRTYAFSGSATASGTTLSIGELLLSDYDTSASDRYVFNGMQFWKLVAALTGAGEDRKDVDKLSAKNAGAIRALNGGKDVVVTIDNKQWTVTDLRKADNGHVIATMWLATSAQLSYWNLWEGNTPGAVYPGNMYATSYIRANALNSGGCGYVATNGAATLTPLAQSAEHLYAKFTMPTVRQGARNLSLTKYIVQPRNVSYQQSETICNYNPTFYTCANEAWGTPNPQKYFDATFNYSNKSHYGEWADDYIWLPSIAETGYSGVAGIWNLSDKQRINDKNTWMRSGYYNSAAIASTLLTTAGRGTNGTADINSVRPAFHLDLTEAAQDAAESVDVPTTDASKSYNGTQQIFALQGYDADKVSVTVSGVDPTGNPIAAKDIAFDATTGNFRVTRAGKYTAEMTLTEAKNTFWWDSTGGNGKRTLVFEIAPKQLTLNLSNNVPNGAWRWTLSDPYTATLTVSGIESGDTIGMQAIYTDKTSGETYEVAGVQSGADIGATIDLSKIAIGEYTLSAALDNDVGQSADYSIASAMNAAGMPRAFVVHAKTVDLSGVGWLHTVSDADGNPIAGQPDHAPIAENAQFVYALYGTLQQYAAYVHHMGIDMSALPKNGDGNLIVDVDLSSTSYNGTTYTGGYSNASGSTVNRYTTKALLKIVDTDYLFDNNHTTYELSLSWEIVKGTFDLSGVKWKYKYTTDTGTVSNVYDPQTTELEYNDGKVIRVEIDSTTMPLGLTAPNGEFDYQNASGVQVQSYTAIVAGDTLEYDDANFEEPEDLRLQWQIVGKGIRTKWKRKAYNTYFIRELNIDPAYAAMVHYRYYDASNNLLGSDAAGLAAMDQMITTQGIGPTNPQDFTIEAYLDGADSGNYRLVGDVRKVITVGDDAVTQIQAQIADSMTYDGNAHYGADELTFTGAPIRPADYTATYYAGTDIADLSKNTKLDGAPTDAGKYVIEIEMHDDSYVLTPSVFAVEITAKQVAVPTVKEATFNGTEYSLLDLLTGYDATLMTLDLVTTATNAGTYRATLTLSNSNYVWTTADGATGLQEYELSWTIVKAKLKEQWVGQADGKQTFVVSDKYADYVQIVYEYYDADGNLVAESDLVAGQTYKVVAKLGAASAENFEFIDVNGDVTTPSDQSAPKQFVYGNDPDASDGSGNNGGTVGTSELWFKIVMITMVSLVGGIFIVLIAIWFAVDAMRRMRKQAQSRKE